MVEKDFSRREFIRYSGIIVSAILSPGIFYNKSETHSQEVKNPLSFQPGPQLLIGTDEKEMGRTLHLFEFSDGEYKISWQGNKVDGEARNFAIGDIDNDGEKEIILLIKKDSVEFDENWKVKKCDLLKLQLLTYESGSTGEPTFYQDMIDGPMDITAVQQRDPVSGEKSYSFFDIKIGDINNDGLNEVVIANGNVIEVYGVTGKRFHKLWESKNLPGGYIYSLEIGDADNDGKDELVASLFRVGSSVVYKHGRDTWDDNPIFTESIGEFNIDYSKIRDVDNDGEYEILAGGTSGRFNVWKNVGGKYATQFVSDPFIPKREKWTKNCFVQSLDAGDIDGDGLNEIIVCPLPNTQISVYRNENGVYRLIDSFEPDPIINSKGLSTEFGMGDLDKDGRPELVGRGGDVCVIEKNRKETNYTIKKMPVGGIFEIG